MTFVRDNNFSKVQITSYEPGTLTLNQGVFHQSIALSCDQFELMPVERFQDLRLDHLQPYLDWQPEVLLLGTGLQCHIPPQAFLGFFLEQKIGFEFMDTQAACRTFTALSAEGRKVVAVLLSR